MTDYRPIFFADGVTEAQVANGVARITLAISGSDGKAVPSATLCIPVTQLPGFVNGMGNLVKQIDERVRAQLQQKQASSAAPDTEAAQAGGAFKFQG